MSLHTIPIPQLTELDIRSLIERRIREDRTLDFKQDLTLDDSGKLDFLADVTAMANASGGTLLYGAVEGEGDDRGVIIDLRGLSSPADTLGLALDNILRDCVDERVPGVEHGPVALAGGTYCYVVRVPASHLAPHMITRRSNRDRFFLRGTLSNDPMNARQIKEVARRADSAIDRALTVIAARIEVIIPRFADWRRALSPGNDAGVGALALHVIPLFPDPAAFDLSDDAVWSRLSRVQPPGVVGGFRQRPAIEGLWNEVVTTGPSNAWSLFLRGGGMEAVTLPISGNDAGGRPRPIDAAEVEELVMATLDEAERLYDGGLLALPAVLGLSILRVGATILTSSYLPGVSSAMLEVADGPQDRSLLSNWAERVRLERRLFDSIWQAWGFRRSFHYDDKGARRFPRPHR